MWFEILQILKFRTDSWFASIVSFQHSTNFLFFVFIRVDQLSRLPGPPSQFLSSIQKCFTATVFDDVASFFFLKVSKIFHKTANSFYVYFFLSLKVQSSQMLKVISWQIDFKFKLLQKSQYWYFLSEIVVDNAVHQHYQQQIMTNIFE